MIISSRPPQLAPSLLIVVAAVASLGAVGCSPDDETRTDGEGSATPERRPCDHDPFVCGADETCWRTGSEPPEHVCMPAQRGAAKGSSCEQDEAAATCDAGLLCGGIPLSGRSTCVAYCDPDATDACPAGERCTPFDAGGSTTLHACIGDDTFG